MVKQSVASSHVATINYDVATRTLTVEYKGGRTYRYLEVDFAEWERLMRAESKGSYLRRVIQPRHRALKIAGG